MGPASRDPSGAGPRDSDARNARRPGRPSVSGAAVQPVAAQPEGESRHALPLRRRAHIVKVIGLGPGSLAHSASGASSRPIEATDGLVFRVGRGRVRGRCPGVYFGLSVTVHIGRVVSVIFVVNLRKAPGREAVEMIGHELQHANGFLRQSWYTVPTCRPSTSFTTLAAPAPGGSKPKPPCRPASPSRREGCGESLK